jgi:hypothetical protein
MDLQVLAVLQGLPHGVSVSLPVISLITAVVVGHSAAKINRKNKMVDVAMHCISRYDIIAQARNQITSHEQAINYYHRYFGLKSDQFDYWLSGLIDAENIASWSYSTLNSFMEEKHVCFLVEGKEECVSFEEGWQASLGVHDAPNATFVRVMEKIKVIAGMHLSRREKYRALIDLLERTERVEKDLIRFADVKFVFFRIRGGDMRAFKKMEERHLKRVEGLNGH